MLKKLVLFTLIILLVSGGFSQAKKQLQEGDIEKVMQTLIELDSWIKDNKIDIGDDEETDEGLEAFMEVMKNVQAINRFFPRNGFSKEEFFNKYLAIMNAWMIAANQQIAGMYGPQMQQMLESIQNNPHMSAQQKQEMLKSMKESQELHQKTMKEAKEKVHPSDLEYVKKNMAILKSYMEKLESAEEESMEME
ncbi:MAG: hypothetical protein Kow00108_12640 [Calditrichia bacterium]